jgi:4-alpha-glucanotransferase
MPSETYEQLLERAAAQCGIDAFYWDIWGRRHETTTDARRTILRGLGLRADNARELEQSLAERARRESQRLAPPCLVVDASAGPAMLPLNAAAGSSDAVRLRLHEENGDVREAEIPCDGQREVPLPWTLPLGYHDLEVSCGERRAGVRLIVAPDRAWQHPALRDGGRAAGLAISLFGVRSARNWGCGDFGDLAALVDWVAHDLQASFIALNPLHAIHNRRPFNSSPYLPNCIFYQNFLYLDVEAIEDFQACPRASKLRRAPEIAAEIEALRGSEFVEYERVAALKTRFLKLAFASFLSREFRVRSPRAAAFARFIQQEGALLERFAVHSTLDEFLHRRNPDVWVWTDWPEPYRDPESPETRAFARRHWRTVRFYQYVQWQIGLQLAAAQQRARDHGLSIGLYHDLALATDRFGADLWAHRPFFVTGCRVGSPPDDFAPQGQDWSFPPPHSEHHWEDGYRLFAEFIRKNCRHGGALRLDHVMRFFRLYWIPDGCDATQGAYVRDRYQDLIRILALESVRNQVVVIGEDLGTVEPEVRETLRRFGILSYRLFYFEKDSSGAFRPWAEYPPQALVASTTHDLPTLAGFWIGADIEARRRAGVIDDGSYQAQKAARALEKQKMLDALHSFGLLAEDFPADQSRLPELTGELHNAVIGFLARTPSQLLAVNQEDLTKELEQQNLPGTTWQYPNWGRKMRFTVEQLLSDPAVRGFTAMFRHWIAKTGRENRPLPE